MDVRFVRIGQLLAENLESEGAKKIKILTVAYKFVQIKFLAMYILIKKTSFDIFMVCNLINIFVEHDLYLIS